MTNLFPALNTCLLLILMALAIWRMRLSDLTKLWDEIAAAKLRLSVVEKTSPCPHCRSAHGAIGAPHTDQNCC